MTTTPMTPDRDYPICTQEAARAAGLDVAPSPAELLATSESIVHAWDDLWAKPEEVTVSVADAGEQLARALPLVLAEVDRLRAQVTELETRRTAVLERHRKHDDSDHCFADDEAWPCQTRTALGAS